MLSDVVQVLRDLLLWLLLVSNGRSAVAATGRQPQCGVVLNALLLHCEYGGYAMFRLMMKQRCPAKCFCGCAPLSGLS
jgi:hypothetical protein